MSTPARSASEGIPEEAPVRISPRLRFGLACIVLALGLAGEASAQTASKTPDKPAIFEQARVGFGEGGKSYYKLGFWTPVEILIRGSKKTVIGDLSLAAPDGDGVHAEVARTEQVNAAENHVARFLVPIGREEPTLRVRYSYKDLSGEEGQVERTVVDRDQGEVAQSETLDPGQALYLVVGSPVGIEGSIKNLQSRWPENQAPQVVTLATTNQLPTRWYGYQCVDVLILSTSRPEMYQAMTDAQKDAISQWVRMGGRLVISAGAASRPLLIEGGLLHEYVPGKLENFKDLNRSQGFDEFTEKESGKLSARLISKGDVRMNVPFLRDPQGQVVARDFDLPLVVRNAHGFGEVTFLAGDLDSRLFLDWAELSKFHSALFDWPDEAGQPTDTAMSGYRLSDISSQLRAGLDQFEGVRLVPFGLVAFLVVLYILLIGPGDYFFVKHVLKGRMEFTWITFPTLVLVVSVASYALAGWLKGSKLRICQAAVIDVDLAHPKPAGGTTEPFVRGVAWANVFSPQTRRYDLSFDPVVPKDETPETKMLVSWLGLPEYALGGMQTRDSVGMVGPAYALDVEENRMLRVPVQVWSTKAVTARWNQTGVDLAEGKLTGSGEELAAGSVTSHVDLVDCFLAYGNSYYALGEMKAGVAVEVPVRKRFELVNRLKNTQLVSKDNNFNQSFESRPYNPRGLEVFDTLEKMMFFRLIDGKKYTTMQNNFQSFLDLTSHLHAGRAILVGRTKTPGALLLDGKKPIEDEEAKTWTCYRFVYPVTPSANEGQPR